MKLCSCSCNQATFQTLNGQVHKAAWVICKLNPNYSKSLPYTAVYKTPNVSLIYQDLSTDYYNPRGKIFTLLLLRSTTSYTIISLFRSVLDVSFVIFERANIITTCFKVYTKVYYVVLTKIYIFNHRFKNNQVSCFWYNTYS